MRRADGDGSIALGVVHYCNAAPGAIRAFAERLLSITSPACIVVARRHSLGRGRRRPGRQRCAARQRLWEVSQVVLAAHLRLGLGRVAPGLRDAHRRGLSPVSAACTGSRHALPGWLLMAMCAEVELFALPKYVMVRGLSDHGMLRAVLRDRRQVSVAQAHPRFARRDGCLQQPVVGVRAAVSA